MNFSTNLKKIRKSLHLSQKEFADLINISQRTISHYENGESEPDLIVLCRLADAFSTSIDKLIGYDANNDSERYTVLKDIVMDYYHKKKEAETKLNTEFPL